MAYQQLQAWERNSERQSEGKTMHAVTQEPESVGLRRAPTAPLLHTLVGAMKAAAADDLSQTAAGTFIATVLALRILGHVNEAVLLWPVSGVALALALPHWQLGWRKRFVLLAGALTGFLSGAIVAGMPLRIASMIAFFTCADVVIGAAMLSRDVRTFDDLKYEKNILRFLVAAALAPLITGSVGAYPISGMLHLPVAQTGLMSVFANGLGIAIVVPAVLLTKASIHHRFLAYNLKSARAGVAAVLFAAVAGYVFWQTTNPFLFMVFPPMILVLLIMGLEGAVLTSVLITAIGWIGTSHGHGPISLIRGGSPLHHLLLLQGFSWICIVTALPVGALLDERERADQSAQESQSIYQAILQNADDLIVLSSLDGTHRYVSPAITRLAGWTPSEYLALDRFETLHPEDRDMAKNLIAGLNAERQEHNFRYRMMHKSGDWKWVEATVRAYGAEGQMIAGYVGTIRDISGLKETEERWRKERRGLVNERRQMADLANTDPLTGLLNRRGFDEKLRLFHNRRRSGHTVLMIDIDFFKKYNDTYGHQSGDACLVKIADVLRSQAARSNDLVARMGGEEFAVSLLGIGLAEGMEVAEKIRRKLRSLRLEHSASPFGIVTLSVGVASQSDSIELDTTLMLSRADSALYTSKRTRDCVSAFEEGDMLAKEDSSGVLRNGTAGNN